MEADLMVQLLDVQFHNKYIYRCHKWQCDKNDERNKHYSNMRLFVYLMLKCIIKIHLVWHQSVPEKKKKKKPPAPNVLYWLGIKITWFAEISLNFSFSNTSN